MFTVLHCVMKVLSDPCIEGVFTCTLPVAFEGDVHMSDPTAGHTIHFQ